MHHVSSRRVPAAPSTLGNRHSAPAGPNAFLASVPASPSPLAALATSCSLILGFLAGSAPLAAQTCIAPAAYGTSSACAAGAPSLSTSGGFPRIGSATFAFDVATTPSSWIIWLIGTDRASIPTPNGTLLVNPILLIPDATASSGTARLEVRLPYEPRLLGGHLCGQGVVIESLARFCLTNGMEATICHEVTVPNMVPLAAGSFLMGSVQGYPNEQPVHTVSISHSFWMGRYEVTQAEFQALMHANPSFFQGPSWPNHLNRPVEMVSWHDAVAYCVALTAREAAANRLPAGYVYRLPTEAEWEYACRAGTTTEWNVGGSLSCAQANTFGCVGQTSVVGSYAGNRWALHDLHGNIYEWCLDHWDGSPNYSVGPVADPYVSSGPLLVTRGSSWGHNSDARSALRGGDYATNRRSDLGFRVVLAPNVP